MENLPATTTGNKMPKGKPFQKGQSGNKSGRPKETPHMRAEFRKLTTLCALELKGIIVGKKRIDPNDKKSKMVYREEPAIRLKAIEIALDRGWGKVANFVGGEDAANAEGNPQLQVPQRMIIEQVFINAPSVHHADGTSQS